MKRNRLISLLLALILCVSLAAPALAEESTTKVIVDGCFQITMDGFLRVDTNRYYCPNYDGTEYGEDYTFYVVKDNSTVTVEVAPGYRYAADFFDYGADVASYPRSSYAWLETNQMISGGGGGLGRLTEPLIFTVSPSEKNIYFTGDFGVYWICESDFARLVSHPYRGDTKADFWARYVVEQAFYLGLFPDGLDPFEDDSTREMTREEFAAALLKLYGRLGGLEEGAGETIASPDDSLTREQAAVMLCRIFAKFGYDLPQTDATDFDDDDRISPWAKPAIAFLQERWIMEGTDFRTFSPEKTLTLQEGMVIVQRMLNQICFDRH